MIHEYVKEIMDSITISFNHNKIVINESYECNLPFSSIILQDYHFCVGEYMFGIYHDNISTCVARMVHATSVSLYNNGWYNLVPLLIINEKTMWTPVYGTMPICITEETYFQESTRTDFKDLEIEDFDEILKFNNTILRCIRECRKNPQ